ncbi:DUF2336 domain-containing protein [Arenibaculum pallidiluteum]|uniref:DUF2336 domain-containing protein n=1 Tax=Arenibaculum pallidiluteum TaxID=2812559 RepID=UPI001A958C10|nr:DUF2336 domain-containing protein [Arenibaculum pallidiluteum]
MRPEEIQTLLSSKSIAQRAALADRAARELDHPEVLERSAAEWIVRALVEDVSEFVRAALSEAVCRSETLPRDVALQLAFDLNASVAAPILEFSRVLTAEDLMRLILAVNNQARCAVARRPDLEPRHVSVLIERGNDAVLASVAGNPEAPLDHASFDALLARAREHTVLRLALRGGLPFGVLRKLLDTLVRHFQDVLSRRPVVPSEARALLIDARQRTLLRIAQELNGPEMERFASLLFAAGELKPTLLIAALRAGPRALFEAGIALRAGLPSTRVRSLLADRSGCEVLCRQAGLPQPLIEGLCAELART